MLIMPDGRTALEQALASDATRATELVTAATQTVPRSPADFAAACTLLLFLVETSAPETRAKALDHAKVIDARLAEGRIDGEALHHLRAMLPAFDMVSDPLPACLALSMIEGFRPQVTYRQGNDRWSPKSRT